MKQEYKQFWDVDLGVSYIPWEKVKLDDLDDFAEGGMIDQETVNSGKNHFSLIKAETLETDVNEYINKCAVQVLFTELQHLILSFNSYAEWETQKNSEAINKSESQSVTAESSATSSTPSEAFTQPVTMMPLPV